ncbi:MAG: META domain-containing protein [Sphingomicrobium sp.]
MKTTFALPLLALGLAACQTYPQGPGYPGQDPVGYPEPAPYPDGQASYRAIGTEPFWDLEIGRDLIFTDRGNDLRVVQPTPRPINGTAGEIYRTQRLDVNIVHSRCSDGMSDRTYPDTVTVRVDGREYRGCGANIAFFGQVGESGYPTGAVTLSGTNWTVIAINGRPTPRTDFYLNFQPDRIAAKFGCNSLGAGYSVTGSTLSAGAVMATRMACPDMSFEDQGSAIMAQPMAISGTGDDLTLSNRAGSITLRRAR